MSIQGVIQLSWGGAGIPASYTLRQTSFPISAIVFYNNTPARLAVFQYAPNTSAGVFPFGGYIIPAFYPQTFTPPPGWTSFAYVTDGTAPFTLSSLSINVQGTNQPTSPLSPFGPSGWGAGSSPSVLTPVNPGDPILAWQINQIISFLTNGGVTGNATIDGTLSLVDQDGVGGDEATLGLNTGIFSIVASATGTIFAVNEAGNILAQGNLGLPKIGAPGGSSILGRLYVAVDGSLHYLSPAGTNTLIGPA